MAECSGCDLANGLNLVGAKAHAIFLCLAEERGLALRGKSYVSSQKAIKNLKHESFLCTWFQMQSIKNS
jgi:hypothetical protein